MSVFSSGDIRFLPLLLQPPQEVLFSLERRTT